jgi:hypothetical protein
MRIRVTVYSKVFLAASNNDHDTSWSARPTQKLMRRLHDSPRESARWIGVMEEKHISMGDPVQDSNSFYGLYVPGWFMDSLGLEDNSEVEVDFKRCEDFPKATKLSFKVMGDIPADFDIRDLIEEPLSQLGVLEVGQIIPIPVLEGPLLLLQESEPEGAVFLDGNEIELDIEQDSVPQEQLPLASLPVPSAEEQPKQESNPFDTDTQMFPMVSAVKLPVVQNKPARSVGRFASTPKFIPFQGEGRKLCE